MTQPKEAWAEVADRMSALALKLKLHTEEELAESGVTLPEIGHKIGAAVSSAAEALADACRDEAIRQDLRDVGTAVSDAIHRSTHGEKATCCQD